MFRPAKWTAGRILAALLLAQQPLARDVRTVSALTAFLTFQFGNGIGKLLLSPGQSGADRMFLVALGAIFIVSFLAMSRFAVNQF